MDKLTKENSFSLSNCYFDSDCSRNYFIFHSLFSALKLHSSYFTKVTLWRFVGLYIEKIKAPDIVLRPEIKYSDEGKKKFEI